MLSSDSIEDLPKSEGVTETVEFQQAVDTFDQLYHHQEKEESIRVAEVSESSQSQTEWKQLKKGASFEARDVSCEKKSSSIRLEKQDMNVSTIDKEYQDSKLVQVLKEFQANESQRANVMYVDDDEDDSANVIQVEKHSLSLQGGDLVEEISTVQEWNLTDAINPDSLRNVDGQSIQRKGSRGMQERKERSSKRQSSKESWSSFEQENNEQQSGEKVQGGNQNNDE